MGGIYLIRHVESGMVCVGQTSDFRARQKQHRDKLLTRQHENYRLQELYSSNGVNTWRFVIVDRYSRDLSELDRRRWLARREAEVIAEYRQAGLCLNIADAELVETKGARRQFFAERAQRNATITAEREANAGALREIQSHLVAARKARDSIHWSITHLQAEIARNSGLRGFLFGTLQKAAVQKLTGQLADEKRSWQAAIAHVEKLHTEQTELTAKAKALYRSYAGNEERRKTGKSVTRGGRIY